MNREFNTFTINKLLRIIVFIFIDTFFSVYFFNLVNYDLLPIAIYNLFIYVGLFSSFYLIKNLMKKGLKRELYQIGISLTGLYLLLILLLKENIVNYIIILGLVNGLGQGFYCYPTNVYDTELISNKDRDKYTGYLNMINMILNIIVPIVLGLLLNKLSYITVGKIIIVIIVLMYFFGFFLKREKVKTKKFDLGKFWKYFKSNFKKLIVIRYLEGLTYSSSAIALVITYYSILYLNNNLYIGILTSIQGALALFTCLLFTKRNKKYDKKIINISNLLITISLLTLFIKTNMYSLCFYLLIQNSLLIYVQLINKNNVSNITNNYKEIKNKYKEEYHLVMELILNIGRITGFILLILISLLKNIVYLKTIIAVSVVFYFILLYLLKDLNE